MIPVKICGITNATDAQLAVKLGASAIGMIFYPQSPRYVSDDQAGLISNSVGNNIAKVGVFVNESIDNIHNSTEKYQLDMIQLHGDEPPEFCSQVQLPVIKAIRVGDRIPGINFQEYEVDAFLLDTYKKGIKGGTGETFHWDMAQNLNISIPVILSGGLNPENILMGIETVYPSAVDVNSGVETKPSEKDEKKMSQLFKVLKNTVEQKNIFKIKENV